MFVVGYAAATGQRAAVMKTEQRFPQASLFGDAGRCKTTAAMIAASLFGMPCKPITRFSESVIYETVKSLGGIPLILDDPIKKGRKSGDTLDQVDNFLWSMFNGTSRRVRGNEQTPHTNVIVTFNIALGEGNQAIESRLIKLYFPVRPTVDGPYQGLSDAMDAASGALSQLLGIEYDREAVREIERQLLSN